MIIHETSFRVKYSDTDQMGFMHHSNYAKYYETARWEAMRELGLSYKEMEEQGIFMPVISMKFDFIKPAYYDDLLSVKTMIHKCSGARIKFEYELVNQTGVLINTAEITLAFIIKETHKPCLPPEYFTKTLQELLLINN
ncbi:MAG TPA: thioesterase family protein [Bacteroidales bacterium]|mgnify:CR=1 FL=1|nr:thioesterase family protein [Bacteroidales bacterium]